jgi:hypothetical protein
MRVLAEAWPEFSLGPTTLKEEDATHGTWGEELKRLAHTTQTYLKKKTHVNTEP